MSSKRKKNIRSKYTEYAFKKKTVWLISSQIDGVKWWMFRVPLQMIVHTLWLLCSCIDSALDEQFGIYSKLCTLVWFNSFEMIYYTFQWFYSNYYYSSSRLLAHAERCIWFFFFGLAFIHIQLFVRLHSLLHVFTQ